MPPEPPDELAEKALLEQLDEPAEQTPSPSRRSVIAELSRQTAIAPSGLSKSDASRSQPIVADRQLAMALLVRLHHMSMPATAHMIWLPQPHHRASCEPADRRWFDESASASEG
jgi:hypothetical protein